MRRVLIALLCVTPWVTAAPARAASPQAKQSLSEALQVTPGATCLQHARVLGHVRMWLGRDTVDAGLRVHVRGDPRERFGVVVDIERDGATRTRDFERAPEGCDDLHAVVGLAVALAIDATALDAVVDPESPPAPTPPRWLATPTLGVAQELLPGTAPAAAVGVQYAALPWLRVRLDALGQYARNARVPGSVGRFDAMLLGVGLSACSGGRAAERLSVALCSGPMGALILAYGRGYAPSRSGRGSLWGIRSGLRLTLLLGIPWVIDLDVVAQLRAPTYEASRDGAEPLQRRPSATGMAVGFGPGFRF